VLKYVSVKLNLSDSRTMYASTALRIIIAGAKKMVTSKHIVMKIFSCHNKFHSSASRTYTIRYDTIHDLHWKTDSLI